MLPLRFRIVRREWAATTVLPVVYEVEARWSWLQEHLDRSPFVHGPVAGCGLFQWQGQVEHLAGVDGAVPDQIDQLR